MQAFPGGAAGSKARGVLPGVLLIATLSCAAAAAQDTGSEALDACLARFDVPEAAVEVSDSIGGFNHDSLPHVEFDELEKQCPDLKDALEAGPYAGWLPEEWWSSRTSIGALVELREQLAREARAPPAGKLDTSGVAAALESLGEDATSDRVSLWQRFIEWLTRRLTPDEPDPENASWLLRLMEKLGEYQDALRITAYGLVALLVALAVVIAINELRAAGVFGPRRVLSRLQRELEDAKRARELTLRDLDTCPPDQRPSLLLSLILAALAQRSRLRVDPSATHREVLARVAPDSAEQRAQLTGLTRCAERVRYAATPPSGRELDAAVTAGRRLLDAIAASGSVSQPAAKPA